MRSKKNSKSYFFRGGSENNAGLSDEAFFETRTKESVSDRAKASKLNTKEVRELLSIKAKLTKKQWLLKSILEKANLSKALSDKGFENV